MKNDWSLYSWRVHHRFVLKTETSCPVKLMQIYWFLKIEYFIWFWQEITNFIQKVPFYSCQICTDCLFDSTPKRLLWLKIEYPQIIFIDFYNWKVENKFQPSAFF